MGEKGSTTAEPLNGQIELCVQATSLFSRPFPSNGLLALGDTGVEFRARDGRGFVQVPWGALDKVVVDAYGRFVRSIDLRLADGRSLPFALAEGARAVRIINEHLGRSKLVPAPHPLSSLVRRHLAHGR